MAKAKYKKGSDGYWKTNVWDGTYTATGRKKYVSIRSNKSSKDLEKKVNEHNQKIKERTLVKNTDQLFYEYALVWLNVYKSGRAHNTKAMYKNVIDTYFTEPVIICNVIKMLYKLSKKSFIVVCMSVAGVKLNSSCIIVKN